MIRKAYIIGTVALGLAIATAQGVPGTGRIASSASRVQQDLRNLMNSDLNPVERVVFGLVMKNTKTAHAEPPKSAPIQIVIVAPRT